jgi:cytochrome c554/c'-like protein
VRRRGVLVFALVVAALPIGAAPPSGAPSDMGFGNGRTPNPTVRARQSSIEEFLARHWRAPLAPQGRAPERFSALEASLAPAACGTCHPAQLADWRTSVHARAMGPGVAGQLVEMLQSAPADALGCQTCHAPLAEQRPLLGAEAGDAANPAFDPALRAAGLVCAGCHVRTHQRFGPPRRDGSVETRAPRDTLPHGGVTRTPAFLASAFCRSCHQFSAGGFALNGKLLENTYEEWKASRFARAGVQCQDCHMPDRRHLWRGIHDPDMVRSGLTIAARPDGPPARRGRTVGGTLTVTSSRVGHAFPTYVTPRVILRGELLDAAGSVVDGSRVDRIVAREVALDLSREERDTRLLPGRSVELRYRRRIEDDGMRLRFTVIVEPDAFYTKFFETLLEQGAGSGTAQIRQALEETRRSPFTVFEQVLSPSAPR